MWNPLVFKRLTKSWEADFFVPELFTFFTWAEQFLNAHFFHPKPILRILSNAKTKAEWEARSKEEAFQDYFGEPCNSYPDFIVPEDGGVGAVAQSGHLNVPIFLEAVKQFLLKENTLTQGIFDYNSIEHLSDGIAYKGTFYDKIIFCEGFQMKQHNPYFKYLPLDYTKGQVLEVKFKKEPVFKGILNKNIFCVATGKDARVGATYEWNQANLDITEEAKSFLCSTFEELCNLPYEVTGQQAGIRPTIKDRRPILGEHPHHKNVYVFNGLGTKGVMLAPYMSAHFMEYLLEDKPLWKEVDIKRYYTRYYA